MSRIKIYNKDLKEWQYADVVAGGGTYDDTEIRGEIATIREGLDSVDSRLSESITEIKKVTDEYEGERSSKVLEGDLIGFYNTEQNKYFSYAFEKDKSYRIKITRNSGSMGAGAHGIRCFTSTRNSTSSGYSVDYPIDYTGTPSEPIITDFVASNNASVLVLRVNAQNNTIETNVVVEVFEIAEYSFKAEVNERFAKIEAKPLAGKKWCAIGDSLTASSTLSGQTEKTNYVEQTEDILGLTATNLGSGGTGYLNGGSTGNVFANRISQIPSDTDIITVFGSLNDFGQWTTVGALGDATTDTLYGAIQSFYNQLRVSFPDTVVGVILPTPWASRSYRSNSSNFKTYIKALKDICEYNSLPMLNLADESGMHPWDDDFKANHYKDGDGTHPLSSDHRKYITPKVCDFIKMLIV